MQTHSQPATLTRRKGRTFAAPFIIKQAGPFGQDGLKCWLAVPARLNRNLPPLLVVHGVLRDAKGMLKEVASAAARTGQLVIAPLFSEQGRPGYQRVLGRSRADLSLIFLLQMLWQNGIANTHTVDLLGYSGGAQFVHRFALLYPHLVRRLNVCSAGWYTMPDASAAYPYGLAAPAKRLSGYPAFMTDNLHHFLQLPIRVFVGEKDNQVDQYTRSGPEIDQQQGTHRLARAVNWVQALRTAASERGLQTDISMTVLENCGHDFRSCVRKGNVLDHLYAHTGSASQVA